MFQGSAGSNAGAEDAGDVVSGVHRSAPRAPDSVGPCAACGDVRAYALDGLCATCAGRTRRGASCRFRGGIVRAVVRDAQEGRGSLVDLAAAAGVSLVRVQLWRREIRAEGGRTEAAAALGAASPLDLHVPRRLAADERPSSLWLVATRRNLLPFLAAPRTWPDLRGWASSFGYTDNETTQAIAWCEEKGDIVWNGQAWEVAPEADDDA